MKRILVILISILTLSSQTMAYEEANYEVVKKIKNMKSENTLIGQLLKQTLQKVMVLENYLIIFQATMKKVKKLR